MQAKLVTALLVGMVLGLGVAFLTKLPEAQAQKQAAQIQAQAPGYEFKVTRFPYKAAESEKQLTELAAERWEYVGVIYSGDHGAASLVAFKRPKK